jgi:cell division topological specificity factor
VLAGGWLQNERAPSARPRVAALQLAQRSGRNAAEPDYLQDLQRDLIAVISKYIKIDVKDIKVNLDRHDNLEVLEVKIELPDAR